MKITRREALNRGGKVAVAAAVLPVVASVPAAASDPLDADLRRDVARLAGRAS